MSVQIQMNSVPVPNDERVFIHTYCTPEIESTMNIVYKILQDHEILYWQKTKVYDPTTTKEIY